MASLRNVPGLMSSHLVGPCSTSGRQPLMAPVLPRCQRNAGLRICTRGLSQAQRCNAAKGSAEAAVKDLRSALRGSTDPAYTAGAAYLKSIGLQNTSEIARVLDVAMNPNSLFVNFNDPKRSKNANARLLDVEADMVPIVEFLRNKGVGVGDIPRILSEHPPLLCYSVEDRLQPFWDYFESLGVTNVAEVVARRPSLLGLDVDNNIKKIVDYLQYVETPPETIVKYLETSI